MRDDSCRQCIRRRIRCDATLPECLKCKKKGITCSGAGKQYRFVDVSVTRRRKKSSRIALSFDDANQSGTAVQTSTSSFFGRAFHNDEEFASYRQHSKRLPEPQALALVAANLERGRWQSEMEGGRQLHIFPTPSLEILDSELRMLFAYFSSTIAPAMVTIDNNSNGYRDIILPLATHDSLVKRAVSVVAALHLGQKRGDLLEPAEKGRSAIIQRLQNDATCGRRADVFSVSTWATIILLLVGETVTGNQEFAPLFRMLQSFLRGSVHVVETSVDAARFLVQQSQMFNLFTPPFLDPASGAGALEQHLEPYLDFLSYPTEDHELAATLQLIKNAIYLTRDLYLHEIRSQLTLTEKWHAVENIRRLLLQINEHTPGMHALVWTYFIAGAASTDPEHRDFFLRRLRQVYRKTEMGNILTAIDTLEHLVWCLPEGQSWTSDPTIFKRVLVM